MLPESPIPGQLKATGLSRAPWAGAAGAGLPGFQPCGCDTELVPSVPCSSAPARLPSPAAASGALDQMTHRGPFQPRTFCDSVIL